MTEENKDSTAPKLKLSRKPKETAADTENKPAAESETAPLTPPAKPSKDSLKMAENRAPEPENPIKSPPPRPKIKQEEPAPLKTPVDPDPQPNGNPEPPGDSGSSGDPESEIEASVNEMDDGASKHGLITSIFVIVILLAVLGAAGYGLYYLLQSAGEDSAPTEETVAADANEGESGNLLSAPIDKAKATISKIQDPELLLAEDEAPAPVEASSGDTNAPQTTAGASETTEKSARTGTASEFLQAAHIGGVRTGNNPKLILNGTSYSQGDIVQAENGLRFIGIRDKKIAFRDAQGIVYVKSF